MSKVWIDAGHGGKDSGAVGYQNVLEKHIVLEVAKELEQALKRCGIATGMSRRSDVFIELKDRATKANNWGADLFVSIHCNSFNTKAYGLETFALEPKYKNLAVKVHDAMIKDKLFRNNRGVKYANLSVLRNTKMPACLVELGFIDNPADCKFVLDNKVKFAEAIAKGICNQLGVKYVPRQVTSEKVFYQVVVGSYEDKQNALNMKAKLEAQGYKGVFLEAERI